jgi:hypothetical protein
VLLKSHEIYVLFPRLRICIVQRIKHAHWFEKYQTGIYPSPGHFSVFQIDMFAFETDNRMCSRSVYYFHTTYRLNITKTN